MHHFKFVYPTHVYFGEDALKEALVGEADKLGNNIMLAYGGGSIKKNGIYYEVRDLLESMGKNVIDFFGIMPNPTYAKLQEGAQIVRDEKIDFILAVGGGSVIDCAKVISAQAALDEDLYDFEFVKKQMPTEGVPIGAVVTASGTGAEMNNGAVITHEEKKWKGGIIGTTPCFAVLNPQYTETVPEMQVMSGAFDTLSHAMETYFGHSDEDNVSDDVALAIMKNTVVNMRRLLVDMNDMQARGNLMWDSAMAENGILKVGRMTGFQVHQIEHQLGAYTDCNHGQGLAVLHPLYYQLVLEENRAKMTKLAKTVFGKDTAEEGVEALSSFIKECGLPTKLSELYSRIELTPEVLREIADSCNIIQSVPRVITHDEIYQIFLKCM